MLDTNPDMAAEQMSRQIDQLSRDLEALVAEWRVMSLRLWPLIEQAEKLKEKWWMPR
jgi:hypothetical protein